MKTSPKSALRDFSERGHPGEKPALLGGCETALLSTSEVGRECECGIKVCIPSSCIEKYFNVVADGQAIRCLTCREVV